MISRKELKTIAREALENHWGIAIALLILTTLFFILLIAIPFVGFIIFISISPAAKYIIPQIFFNIKRHKQLSITEILLWPFKKLKTYWGLALRTLQKLLPFVLLYILGMILISISETKDSLLLETLATLIGLIGYILLFIQSLYYTQAIYIITDNPTISCRDAVIKSKELMTGHRFEYFVLKISFFGWAALAYLSCGLGNLYVFPYMHTTYAAYYDELAGIKECTEENNNEVVQS